MKTFLAIWVGQLISVIGSSLTGFALGVWFYQQTGSVTQFALISVTTTLPGILLAPLAGAIADRWSRRWLLIVSDVGAGVSSLAIAVLFLTGNLGAWQIYVTTAVSSLCAALRWPAYSASIPLLVPERSLGRANGMLQIARAAGQLVGPALAGALLGSLQLGGIVLIDVATFVVSIFVQLLWRIPNPPSSVHAYPQGEWVEVGSGLFAEIREGWRYLATLPGLLAIILLFTASNLLLGIVMVLATPLVLSIADAPTLGFVLSTGGIGMLLGSLLMSAWGGPRRRVNGMYGFMLLEGLAIVLAGVQPTTLIFAIAAFGFFFALPLDAGCSQAILHAKLEARLQGRVFSTQHMLGGASLPVGFLLAGPLGDRFEPHLIFLVSGATYVLLTGIAYLYPRLRLVEIELPDAVYATPSLQFSEALGS